MLYSLTLVLSACSYALTLALVLCSYTTNREALNRYYELEKTGMEAEMKGLIEEIRDGRSRDGRMHLNAPIHNGAMQPHLNAPINAHIPAEQDACYGSAPPPRAGQTLSQSSQQLESGSNASSHPLRFFQVIVMTCIFRYAMFGVCIRYIH